MTLEEVDSAESLASNLEKIELPDHLVAVLVDPLMQKFMMLRPDKDLKRASAWMDIQIAEILNGDADEEVITNTLTVIHEYARSTKVGTCNLALLEDGLLTSRQDISAFFPGLVELIARRSHLRPTNPGTYDVLAYAPLTESKGKGG